MIFAVPMVVIMHILLYFLMILLHKSKVTVQPLDVKKYYAAIGISLFFCSVSKDGVGRL